MDKRINRTDKAKGLRPLIGLLILGGAAAPVVAANHTWTGGGTTGTPASGDWNSGSNWSGGLPPSGVDTDLTFRGTDGYISNNDIASPFTLNELFMDIDAGVSATITGGTLLFSQDNSETPVLPYIRAGDEGTLTIENDIVIANELRLGGTGRGTIVLAGDISGVGGLRRGNLTGVAGGPDRDARFILQGDNTYTGLTFIATTGNSSAATVGTVLRIQSSTALGATGTGNGTTIDARGSLEIDGTGGNLSIAEEILYRTSTAGGIVNIGGSNTITPAVTIEPFSNSNGDRQNYFISQAGTLTLAGGIVKSTATGNASHLSFGGAGDMNIAGINASEQTNAWTVRKFGAGTVRFTGATTYNGDTTVAEGTLLVNSTTANNNNEIIVVGGDYAFTGSGTINVSGSGSGVLGGTGTITNVVRIKANTTALSELAGGALSPGDPAVNNGIGTLTIKTLNIEGQDINATGGAGRLILDIASSTSHDQVVVTNALNLNSNAEEIGPQLVLNFSPSFTGEYGDFIRLIDFTNASGSISGMFANAAEGARFFYTNEFGQKFELEYGYHGGTGNDFGLTVVPEPSSLSLLALGGLSLLRRRRRA